MRIRLLFSYTSVLVFNRTPNFTFLNRFRRRLLILAGAHVGKFSHISSPLSLEVSLNEETMRGIRIGSRTFVNSEVRFSSRNSEIIIGNRCMIGPRVCFETGTHDPDFSTFYADHDATRLPRSNVIVVRDGAWIGAGAIILSGVQIGERSVVAAGAVVRQDVEPDTLVGGVPAKRLKSLNIM